MNADSPEIDIEGSNVTASLILDNHHDPVGYSEFGDDLFDTCEVCGFGVGWLYDQIGRDLWGHATGCDVEAIEAWIAATRTGRSTDG